MILIIGLCLMFLGFIIDNNYCKLIGCMIIFAGLATGMIGCSTQPDYDRHFVKYEDAVGSIWYAADSRALYKYEFYNDSVVHHEYVYSPGNQGVIDSMQVTAIFKYVCKVSNKNKVYVDGDNDAFYTFDVQVQQYSMGGAPIYTGIYQTWFIYSLDVSHMNMGVLDESKDIQGYYTYSPIPPVDIVAP